MNSRTEFPLPKEIKILEVGPRDGFQNLDVSITTSAKLEIIRALTDAGIRRIEATSFVSPTWVPQLKDADEVIGTARTAFPEISFSALIPNLKGLDRAVRAGVAEVVLVVCTTETLNRKNFNRSPAESIAELVEVVRLATTAGVRVRATVAAAFGCPYEGAVSASLMIDTARRVAETGVAEIGLADTTGVAQPMQVGEYLARLRETNLGCPVSLHFHDTLKTGMANVMAAAVEGITTFETSIAGLGGCPFAPGAPGNVATESVVYLFEKMGVKTGIDLDALLACAARTREVIRDSAVIEKK